jgi:4a-hydroxytetrahydrobiopterin dehydratase
MPEELKVYSEGEIKSKLTGELSGWTVEANYLKRVYQTDGWPTTLMAVNAIAFLAEAANHHPDLTVSWSKVGVSLQSHSAGGITAMDLELAKKIEAIVLWRPSLDSVFKGGTNKEWVRAG